jgi:hypothetical protein
LPARAVALVRSLPDHPLLDRLVRGRVWIPLLGVMLVGIVAMQVEVLKLGATVGRSLQLTGTLQSRNQLLRANVAALADDQRIERIAAGMGMVMPAPTGSVFLSPRAGSDVQRAVANIHQPDPTTFLASLPTAPVAGQSTAAGATSTTTGGTALSNSGTATATPTGGAATSAGGAATGGSTGTTGLTGAGGTGTGVATGTGVSGPGTTSSAGGPTVSSGGTAGATTGGAGTAPTVSSGATAGAGGVALAQSTQTASTGG